MNFLKPKFWDRQHLTIQSIILYPFTYILDLRKLITIFIKPRKYSNIKTICIGNIYLGGTGKTPLVDFIAKIFKKKFKTVIIKKGHASHLDEMKLLRKNNKVFFAKDREKSLKDAISKKFELAIFDDGLQDFKLKYDLRIVCFSSLLLAGNELRIPSGPLREKLNNLRNFDAVFINGRNINKRFLRKIKTINPHVSIFSGEYVASNYNKFRKNNYLTFSGIGNPNSFKNILNKYRIKNKLNLVYPDHFNYSESEIKKIKDTAKLQRLKILTTEKDFYRIPIKLRKNINFLKVNLKIKKLKEFEKFILKYL